MKQLTRNAIKTIVEKKEQAGDGLVLQILDLVEFTEETKKKKIGKKTKNTIAVRIDLSNISGALKIFARLGSLFWVRNMTPQK